MTEVLTTKVRWEFNEENGSLITSLNELNTKELSVNKLVQEIVKAHNHELCNLAQINTLQKNLIKKLQDEVYRYRHLYEHSNNKLDSNGVPLKQHINLL